MSLDLKPRSPFDPGRIQKPYLLEIQLLSQLLDQEFLSYIFWMGFSDSVASSIIFNEQLLYPHFLMPCSSRSLGPRASSMLAGQALQMLLSLEATQARESLWPLAKPALGFANYDLYAPSIFDLLLSTLLMFICLFIIKEVLPYLPMTKTIRFRKNVVSPWYLWFHIHRLNQLWIFFRSSIFIV